MGWEAQESESGISITPTQTYLSPVILLRPYELCHVTVRRASSGTDRVSFSLLTSTNGALFDTVPYERYVLPESAFRKSVIIGGVYSFRISLTNAEASHTDTLLMEVLWRRNGVSR